MKTLLLACLLGASFAAAQPNQISPVQTANGISLTYWHYPLPNPLSGFFPVDLLQRGIAVTVQDNDPSYTQFQITINYLDGEGLSLKATKTVSVDLSQQGWTAALFPVGSVTLKSVVVIPLHQSQSTMFLIEKAAQ